MLIIFIKLQTINTELMRLMWLFLCRGEGDSWWQWVRVCSWDFQMYPQGETTGIEKGTQSETSSVKNGCNVKLLMSYPTFSFLFHFKHFNIYSNQKMLFSSTYFIAICIYFSRIYIFHHRNPNIICIYPMRCKAKKYFLVWINISILYVKWRRPCTGAET